MKKIPLSYISIHPLLSYPMSTGVVQYKFKHQNGFDRIEFASNEISVGELKVKIAEKLGLLDPVRGSTGLEIARPADGELYDFDDELLPSHTSVLVLRVPSKVERTKISVDSKDFFIPENATEGDYLKLRESVIAAELASSVRRCPDMAVCPVCRALLLKSVILGCCGWTVCATCGVQGAECPVEKNGTVVEKLSVSRGVSRLVSVIAKYRSQFVFETVTTPSGFLDEKIEEKEEVIADDEAVIDLDADDHVVDVENPKPLTARERQMIEKREKRKRKAIEILEKRGDKKIVKGELTEGEINSLLKAEMKAELGLIGADTEGEEQRHIGRAITVEFPRLLTPEEFARWSQTRM